MATGGINGDGSKFWLGGATSPISYAEVGQIMSISDVTITREKLPISYSGAQFVQAIAAKKREIGDITITVLVDNAAGSTTNHDDVLAAMTAGTIYWMKVSCPLDNDNPTSGTHNHVFRGSVISYSRKVNIDGIQEADIVVAYYDSWHEPTS